jgi:hypothetical protein
MALMMEAAGTSETSVNFYQSTRRNNQEVSHLHAIRHSNPKNCLIVYVFRDEVEWGKLGREVNRKRDLYCGLQTLLSA